MGGTYSIEKPQFLPAVVNLCYKNPIWVEFRYNEEIERRDSGESYWVTDRAVDDVAGKLDNWVIEMKGTKLGYKGHVCPDPEKYKEGVHVTIRDSQMKVLHEVKKFSDVVLANDGTIGQAKSEVLSRMAEQGISNITFQSIALRDVIGEEHFNCGPPSE